jgi:hypothetical protein
MQQPDARQLPAPGDIRTMLSDICANAAADLSYDKMSFAVTGSDDAVKSALSVISGFKFVTQSQYQIRVKIELANEHKEFVSGKKNGKINKIMGQSECLLGPVPHDLVCANEYQATYKSYLTASTSTTSTLMSWPQAMSR